MMNPWTLSASWVGLVPIATQLAIWSKISTALVTVATAAQSVIGLVPGAIDPRGNLQWVAFLVCTGTIVLTFLASAEHDLVIFINKWRRVLLAGRAKAFGPFLAFQPESFNHSSSAILVPHWHNDWRRPDPNCSCERIFSSPASSKREEVTRNLAYWRACGRGIGERNGRSISVGVQRIPVAFDGSTHAEYVLNGAFSWLGTRRRRCTCCRSFIQSLVGVQVSSQRSALWPGKRNHYV